MAFNFSDKTYAIEICNKQYFLTQGDVGSLVALRKLYDEVDKLKSLDQTSIDFIQAHEPIVRDFLDGLFGEGSYAEIFSGRKVNLADMLELVGYVAAEIEKLSVVKDFAEKAADILEVADEPASS